MKRKTPKRARAAGGIFLLCAVSIFLTSCLGWILEKPSFTLRGIGVSPRSLTEMNLLVSLDVQNPNRFDLTLRSFECTMHLGSEEVGKGRLEREIVIPSSSTTTIQVPVDLRLKNLTGGLIAILKTGGLPYRIEGKAGLRTAFGSVEIPFYREGPLPLGR